MRSRHLGVTIVTLKLEKIRKGGFGLEKIFKSSFTLGFGNIVEEKKHIETKKLLFVVLFIFIAIIVTIRTGI